ncbi:tetratricopeptide repeat protein [Rosenbergiella epipactidis]|uniref:tetratricopeptide repeat protein n=1 Tax=Rosenbergiella epipactidis TaxID=1544694 RepID=UPI001F4D96BB|nr:tight adherance operon protein [Rosenbergiella epipactidis]
MVNSVRFPIISLLVLSLMTGCTSSGNGDYSKKITPASEGLLLKVKNYTGLIKLKREELKKSNNPKVRYDLADYYYQSQDYRSSMYYLKPLLASGASADIYLLQAKNLSALGEYKKSLQFVDIALSKERNNSDGLNLKGVIQAQMGEMDSAINSFMQSRSGYKQEENVVNNIAMVYIIQKKYTEAVQLLLPIYLRGVNNSQIDHNLIFALAKSGDLRYAKDIIKKKSYSKHPDLLATDLFNIQTF